MKTKIFTFLLVVIGIMVTMGANASNETTVSNGSTVNYTVTNGDGVWTGAKTPTYSWVILKADQSTPAISGTDYTATLGTTASNSIKWESAGTYYISIIATDANGCKSDPFITEIKVTNLELCITSKTGLETCSMVDTDPSTTSTINSGNAASSGYDNFKYTAAITGGTANREYTVSYTVGGQPGIGTWKITTNASGAGSVEIDFNSTSYPSLFNNTEGTNKSVKVAVTTVSDGTWTSASGNLCTTPSYDINVLTKPSVHF